MNRVKKRNDIMSVIVPEMTFDKCEHPFLIKSMKKGGVEEA